MEWDERIFKEERKNEAKVIAAIAISCYEKLIQFKKSQDN